MGYVLVGWNNKMNKGMEVGKNKTNVGNSLISMQSKIGILLGNLMEFKTQEKNL